MELFRLIVNGLGSRHPVEPVLKYMKTGIGLDENSVKRILTRPPGIVVANEYLDVVERHSAILERMGCRLTIEPVSIYPRISFIISKRDEKLINKELSKVLRAQAQAVIFLVEIRPLKTGFLFPSMMGPIKDKIEDYFRDSDTVIGIDDRLLAVFCFATGFRGALVVAKILCKAFMDLLNGHVSVTAGYAVFPEQGRSVVELFTFARMNPKEIIGDPKESRQGCVAVQEKVMPVKFCFTKAHGKAFRKLLSMDPETLWTGLGVLSRSEQLDFLARLPFDSPLIPELKQKIDNNTPPTNGNRQNLFETLIDQMELEERILNLQEIRNAVLTKLNRVEDLPIMPSIAANVYKLANDPQFSIGYLAKVLENDTLLKSKLITTANSAFYGSVRKVKTVKQAIVLLGVEKIMDLAFGIAAEKIFDIETPNQAQAVDPAFFWRHSIVTALIAQELCKDMQQYSRTGVFTAGLLHDLGKLFFIENFPELYGGIYNELDGLDPLFELEEERLGINHAIAGKCLSIQWALPEPVIEAITYHHYPHMASTYSELAAMIGLADYLSYQSLDSGKTPHKGKGVLTGLSYGHLLYLRNIYPSIGKQWLDHMAARIRKLIEDNSELIHVLERGTSHDTTAFGLDKRS